jgi:hypothetical protein
LRTSLDQRRLGQTEAALTMISLMASISLFYRMTLSKKSAPFLKMNLPTYLREWVSKERAQIQEE